MIQFVRTAGYGNIAKIAFQPGQRHADSVSAGRTGVHYGQLRTTGPDFSGYIFREVALQEPVHGSHGFRLSLPVGPVELQIVQLACYGGPQAHSNPKFGKIGQAGVGKGLIDGNACEAKGAPPFEMIFRRQMLHFKYGVAHHRGEQRHRSRVPNPLSRRTQTLR